MNDETINEMIIKCPACGIEGVAKSIMKELEIPQAERKRINGWQQRIKKIHWNTMMDIPTK